MRYYSVLPPLSQRCKHLTLSRSSGYVTYSFLTLSPLTIISITQSNSPFDLHVLATPPAFVLSQDQTLQFVSLTLPPKGQGSSKRTQRFRSRNEIVKCDCRQILTVCTLFKRFRGERDLAPKPYTFVAYLA